MHRLFTAIRPPPAIRAALLSKMGGIAGAHWQGDAQLHLTLRFIGKVERPVAEDIAAALLKVRAQPFVLALRVVGAFERKSTPDQLWAGVSPTDAVTALHRKIDRVLVDTGLAPETRAYQPHITMARFGRVVGDVRGFLAENDNLRSDPFGVDAFELFESHAGPDGMHYEPVAHYPFGTHKPL